MSAKREWKMELRQIEYFSAVNRYKNYTKAAQELHVSQPTIMCGNPEAGR